MKQQQQQPEPGQWTPIEDARKGLSVLLLIAEVLAVPAEVCLRTRFGRHYLGMQAFLALFAILFWMLFFPGEDPRPIMFFWWVYLAMIVRARVESTILAARGRSVHTRYNGQPRLAAVFRKWPERKIKAFEPFVTVFAGILLFGVSEPLGGFVIASGCSLAVVMGVLESTEQAKAEQMRDAWIEQQQLAQRFRELQESERWL